MWTIYFTTIRNYHIAVLNCRTIWHATVSYHSMWLQCFVSQIHNCLLFTFALKKSIEFIYGLKYGCVHKQIKFNWIEHSHSKYINVAGYHSSHKSQSYNRKRRTIHIKEIKRKSPLCVWIHHHQRYYRHEASRGIRLLCYLFI